jgi:hypothetical protein
VAPLLYKLVKDITTGRRSNHAKHAGPDKDAAQPAQPVQPAQPAQPVDVLCLDQKYDLAGALLFRDFVALNEVLGALQSKEQFQDILKLVFEFSVFCRSPRMLLLFLSIVEKGQNQSPTNHTKLPDCLQNVHIERRSIIAFFQTLDLKSTRLENLVFDAAEPV